MPSTSCFFKRCCISDNQNSISSPLQNTNELKTAIKGKDGELKSYGALSVQDKRKLLSGVPKIANGVESDQLRKPTMQAMR